MGLIQTKTACKAGLQAAIDRRLESLSAVRVLEAGCGSTTNIKLPLNSHITGIDISEGELNANPALSERVLGDLQSHDFGPDRFDLIVCWDVLEHLPAPEQALGRMASALRPGGLLLIKVPNRNSLKARVVQWTPYWFHRVVYKLLYQERFGRPGIIPFRTYFRPAMASRQIEALAKKVVLHPEFFATYESGVQLRLRRKLHISDRALSAIERMIDFCSFGSLTIGSSECVYLYRKAINVFRGGPETAEKLEQCRERR